MGDWRTALFRFTHPDEYHQIAAGLNEQRASRERDIENTVQTLQQQLLEENDIEAEISGRPKHIYSIYRKMQRKGIPIEAVYDIQALRVLVNNEATCYRVLSMIHRLWTPIPDQFDDYIANPKPNGYQSLHTAVMDDGRQFVRGSDTYLGRCTRTPNWGWPPTGATRNDTAPSRQRGKRKILVAEQAIEEKISWLRMLLDDSQPNGRVSDPPQTGREKGRRADLSYFRRAAT